MAVTITIADWEFSVDTEATLIRTMQYSTDHCTCAYCRNYYETLDMAHPRLRPVLGKFGIAVEGPCELMPLEPNVMLACYRVDGTIISRGQTRIYVDDVSITPEEGENGTFLLWVGEMVLPWIQEEAMEDVISPANQPEFLERMAQKWAQLHEDDYIIS